ncbi:antiterminator Q family protein [Vibrio salinus]|uniref:antiterminator Q family protein n=1 Tax=Vibrio salinus TaxID=2899784 RepID=UPI001E57412C|nr:antiterminator Q family protein [Vibrio salinus]MCE0495753.1 hypothetical protein [Vibrio salinus]
MRDLQTTRKILRSWGAWANNKSGVGWYTEMCGLSNVLPREIKGYVNPISDEDALNIDRMVAQMYDHNNPRPMSFFLLSYVYNMSNCEIARRATKADDKKVSEAKVRNALMLMETFIAGRLTEQDEVGKPISIE